MKLLHVQKPQSEHCFSVSTYLNVNYFNLKGSALEKCLKGGSKWN
jgi:hypothetical protein